MPGKEFSIKTATNPYCKAYIAPQRINQVLYTIATSLKL